MFRRQPSHADHSGDGDLHPGLPDAAIADATVNVGEMYALPTISFTGSDTVSATINWGDGTTDSGSLTEPSFNSTQLVPMPGSLSDSHVYSEPPTPPTMAQLP